MLAEEFQFQVRWKVGVNTDCYRLGTKAEHACRKATALSMSLPVEERLEVEASVVVVPVHRQDAA
jgi:hypothetical protein